MKISKKKLKKMRKYCKFPYNCGECKYSKVCANRQFEDRLEEIGIMSIYPEEWSKKDIKRIAKYINKKEASS